MNNICIWCLLGKCRYKKIYGFNILSNIYKYDSNYKITCVATKFQHKKVIHLDCLNFINSDQIELYAENDNKTINLCPDCFRGDCRMMNKKSIFPQKNERIEPIIINKTKETLYCSPSDFLRHLQNNQNQLYSFNVKENCDTIDIELTICKDNNGILISHLSEPITDFLNYLFILNIFQK